MHLLGNCWVLPIYCCCLVTVSPSVPAYWTKRSVADGAVVLGRLGGIWPRLSPNSASDGHKSKVERTDRRPAQNLGSEQTTWKRAGDAGCGPHLETVDHTGKGHLSDSHKCVAPGAPFSWLWYRKELAWPVSTSLGSWLRMVLCAMSGKC